MELYCSRWNGGIKNLLSYEGHGEQVVWDLIRFIMEDELLSCGSRIQWRYIFSVSYIGQVKARNVFHAGLNAVYRRVLKACRRTLFEAGFSWYPDELVLHYRKAEGQRISLGTVVDFRELFLPWFRYAYVKACKQGCISAEDFELDHSSRGEEIYTLGEEAKKTTRKIVEEVMNTQVYYLGTTMPLHKAMKECARYLCTALLHNIPEVKEAAGPFRHLLEKPFIPFVCVPDEKTFNKLFKFFQQVETFCSRIDKDPPFSMADMLD